MKDVIRLGLTLMVIGLIASIALALTNEVTKSQIELQKETQLKHSLVKAVPEAKDFEKWHIGLWAERIDRVYHKDDPQWPAVTLCYLRGTRCPELEAGFIRGDQ